MSEPDYLGEVHFWIGCAAIVAGFTALAVHKGNRVHRAAGGTFMISMVLLSVSGLWLSLARDILFTIFLSAIAFHSVATGWASAALHKPVGRLMTRASPIVSGVIVIGAAYSGMLAAAAPGGVLNDLAPGAFYTVAGVGLIIFIYDLVFAFAQNPSEQRRLTRHLWRMGFSFFLAVGIFFFGNNHVLPEALRTPAFLSAPVLAVVLWTIFYAFRTRFGKRAPR